MGDVDPDLDPRPRSRGAVYFDYTVELLDAFADALEPEVPLIDVRARVRVESAAVVPDREEQLAVLDATRDADRPRF